MTVRAEALDVSAPSLRAVRWWSDELYAGMKETYSVARVDAGRSTWWSRGRVWDVAPGAFLLTQPGDVHRDVSRDGPGSCQIVSLPLSAVEQVLGKPARLPPLLAKGDERAGPFAKLHAAIDGGAAPLELEVAVTEAIAALASVAESAAHQTRPVRRAVDLLRERLAEPITLDELARVAELDKFHLCRAFRDQVGMPPHAYLTRLRIMRAKELLARGVRPTDIAPQVGLYDQSQLNRHFRKIVGTTPARWASDLSIARG